MSRIQQAGMTTAPAYTAQNSNFQPHNTSVPSNSFQEPGMAFGAAPRINFQHPGMAIR